jgi:excisionase family DNA binding protein
MRQPLLRTSDVARRLGVRAATVRCWCETGIGPDFVRTPGGHYLFKPSDVDRWEKSLRTSEESDAA